ncbi:MAG: hypothetical protein AAFV88_09670 [Planctomycetota bacterium]
MSKIQRRVQKRVLKVGGSLLTCEDLPQRLDRWLASEPNAETIAIVGGGELIDAMRTLDSIQPIASADLHWQCVDLLQITFQWLGTRLSGWQILSQQMEFHALQDRWRQEQTIEGRTLMAVASFYSRRLVAEDNSGLMPKLPMTWATTTDAIAGSLAIAAQADELVLVKSCHVDPGQSLAELASQGVIDEAMPGLADQLPPVRFINLRSG